MVTNSDIGLVAWGLKLGKDVFFSIGNINSNDTEIVRTLEDARGIINMAKTNQVFYSLEFTSQYKVYTVYKTINDWGNRNNAYLALSLFVKYPVVFKGGILSVLNSLVDTYDLYIDENIRIKKTKEDRELFIKTLNNFKSEQDLSKRRSRPNDEGSTGYAYIRYKDDHELVRFFDNPYLKDYSQYKEIYFLEEGNDNINAIDIPLLKIIPSPLYRTISFEIKDEDQKPVLSPIQCYIEHNLHDHITPYEIKDEHKKTLNVKFKATGYSDFFEIINLEQALLQNQPYLITLKKRQNVTLNILEDDDNSSEIPGANVKIRKDKNSKPELYRSNEKGEALLEKFYTDEHFYIYVEKEGFEEYNEPYVSPKNPFLIILKKKKSDQPPPNLYVPTPVSPLVKGDDTPLSPKNDTPPTNGGGKDDKTGNGGQGSKSQPPSKPGHHNNAPGFIRKNWPIILIGLAFIAIVSMAAWYYFIYMEKNQKLSETKENLMKVLTKEYSSVTIQLGGIQSEISTFDSAGIGNLYGTFIDLENKIGALENMTKTDSINFGQKIQDFTSQDTTAQKLETEITTTFANHRKETQTWQDSLMKFKDKAQAERERMQKESASNAANSARRAELKRLAETMCNGKSNNARNYKQEVEANKVEFTDVEKRDLALKFDLIHNMLNLEFKGREKAASIDEQNQHRDALRGIRNSHGNKLSQTQKAWLNNAISAKWRPPGQ